MTDKGCLPPSETQVEAFARVIIVYLNGLHRCLVQKRELVWEILLLRVAKKIARSAPTSESAPAPAIVYNRGSRIQDR